MIRRGKHVCYGWPILGLLLLPMLVCAQDLERRGLATTGDLQIRSADQAFLQGYYDHAAALLDSQLILTPDDPILLYNRAVLVRINGSPADALPWLEEAASLAPRAYYIAGDYGWALTERGKLEEGEHWLAKALRQEDEYYPASIALGHNLRLQNRLEDAVKVLRQAVKDPQVYHEAWLELAAVHEERGETEERCEALLGALDEFAYAPVLEEITRYHFEQGNMDSVLAYGLQYLTWYPKLHSTAGYHAVRERCRQADPTRTRWPDTTYSQTAYLTFDTDSTLCAPPVGQRFSYNVYFGFIGLGRIEVDAMEGMFRGDSTWWMQAVLKSARGLPFIDITDTFYVHIARDFTHALWVESRYWEKAKRAIGVHDFNYDRGWVDIREVQGDNHWAFRRLDLPPNSFDPISAILLAPQVVLGEETGMYNTLLSDGMKYTVINVSDRFEELEEAGGTWDTRYIDGRMDYHGVAGINGYYQGWFTHDCDFSMPIMAKFKLVLGSVTVRLDDISPTPLQPARHWK